MKLSEARYTFARLLVDLLHWATEQGYIYAFDEIMQHQGLGHMPGSLHYSGCAGDILLYDKENNYLTNSDAYKPLGERWKQLHPYCHWGGDFSKPDGGHFSFSPPNLFGNKK